MKSLSTHQTFVLASLSFILVFATAGAPISLFNIYRQQDGFTNADLGMVSLGYFLAAAVALLMFGRISNFIGRKWMSLLALASVLASCVLLLNMHDVLVLLVARILQGFACGVASSSIGAYVVDTSEHKPAWLVAAVTSSSPMIGISTGAISSGALASWGPAPRTLIFFCLLMLVGLSFLLFLRAPETIRRSAGAWSSLWPQLYFPKARKWAFLTLTFSVIPTWSLGAFYQAFGPSIVAEQLGTSSAVIAALAFSSVMILTPMGGFFTRSVASVVAVRVGMLMFLGSGMLIVLSLQQGWLLLFLFASFLVGLAQGIATTACMKVLLNGLVQENRAGLLATVYVVSYCGAVFPGIGASLAAGQYSVFQICIGYLILGGVSAVLAMAFSRKMASK